VRFSNYAPLGVIAAALLAGCSSDPAATTAPTTPSFSQTSPIDPTHLYSLDLSCSQAASFSDMMIVVFGEVIGPFHCGASTVFGGIGNFAALVSVRDQPLFSITQCTFSSNTTGDFKCKTKKWSATLTVTDLGPA